RGFAISSICLSNADLLKRTRKDRPTHSFYIRLVGPLPVTKIPDLGKPPGLKKLSHVRHELITNSSAPPWRARWRRTWKPPATTLRFRYSDLAVLPRSDIQLNSCAGKVSI